MSSPNGRGCDPTMPQREPKGQRRIKAREEPRGAELEQSNAKQEVPCAARGVEPPSWLSSRCHDACIDAATQRCYSAGAYHGRVL